LLVLDGLLRVVLLVEPPREANERPDLIGLLRDPAVLVAALVVAVGVGGWGLLEPLLPPHLERASRVTPGTVGLMFTVATLFYGLSAPLVERVVERRGIQPTMAWGVLLMALALPLVTLSADPIRVGVALTAVSVLYAFALNPTFSALAEAVDRRGTDSYASVYAVYNIAYGIGMIGSDVLAGFLTHHVSFRAAVCVASLIMLCALPALSFGRFEGPSTGDHPPWTP
jgi:predicted MFS family arabinose efflux permease